jgi:hypothetical protein
MMIQMPAREEEQQAAAPQQTWLSFFAEMLPSVSLGSAQVRQRPPELQLLPDAGVENVEMYRVHGVVLSTGNVWQLMILRAFFPNIEFNTPQPDMNISSFTSDHSNSDVRNFLNSQFNNYESDEVYHQRLQLFLRQLRGDGVAYDNENPGDDLPTKIAKAIAQTYYETLELTVADIQTVITRHYGQSWCDQPLELDNFHDDFVNKIIHALIDNGRMELRAILPYEGIVEVAVNELKHPLLTLENAIAWMKVVLEQLAEWLTDCIGCGASPSNP